MFLLLEAQFSQGRMVPSNLGFLVQGSPFLFNGFNAYWMMKVASDPDNRHKVTDAFREASAAGLTVCRTWAFGDGGDPALQISPGVYDERVFQVQLHVIFHYSHIVNICGYDTKEEVKGLNFLPIFFYF